MTFNITINYFLGLADYSRNFWLLTSTVESCVAQFLPAPCRKKEQSKSVNKHASHNWKCDHERCTFRARFQHMKAVVWLVADQMMTDLIYVRH